jgi:hypothetical protein
MWSSAALGEAAPAGEWLQLEWDEPTELRTVQVVFDDDVDEYLNNLHRHRTPFEVMPELVRDYRLLARGEDGRWQTVQTVRGNRRRHRVHRFAQPLRTGALRIAVDGVHGARHAHVVAVRAYAR